MKKGSNESLATEEFITIIKEIGKLINEIDVSKETLFNKQRWLTEATLTWTKGELNGAVSNLSILIAAIDPKERPSIYFEKVARQYAGESFYSIKDLLEHLSEIKLNFLANKLAYGETFELIKPLADAVESALERAYSELRNANKSHNL